MPYPRVTTVVTVGKLSTGAEVINIPTRNGQRKRKRKREAVAEYIREKQRRGNITFTVRM